MSTPDPSTATVGPPPASAPRCAAASTPRASPLITATPCSARPAARCSATAQAYGEPVREPTTATAGAESSAGSPRTQRTAGGSSISASCLGYAGSVQPIALTPARAPRSRSRAARARSSGRREASAAGASRRSAASSASAGTRRWSAASRGRRPPARCSRRAGLVRTSDSTTDSHRIADRSPRVTQRRRSKNRSATCRHQPSAAGRPGARRPGAGATPPACVDGLPRDVARDRRMGLAPVAGP